MVSEGKSIVTYENEVYDATEFKTTHPGGSKFIDDHIGEDITQLFNDHDHSKIALRLLGELKIGTLSTNTVSEDSKTKEFEDESWRQYIEPSEGAVYQVFTKLNGELYLKFLNDPKHLTKPGDILRMYKSPFIDFFTRTPWYVVGLFWTPFVIYHLYLGYFLSSVVEEIWYFILGIVIWTYTEYVLHRFLLHSEEYIAHNRYLRTLHFMGHGVHHCFPMDKDRLVSPIALTLPLYLIIAYLVGMICPVKLYNPLVAGILISYSFYDMFHYYLHHAKAPKTIEYRKRYHMYKNHKCKLKILNNLHFKT